MTRGHARGTRTRRVKRRVYTLRTVGGWHSRHTEKQPLPPVLMSDGSDVSQRIAWWWCEVGSGGLRPSPLAQEPRAQEPRARLMVPTARAPGPAPSSPTPRLGSWCQRRVLPDLHHRHRPHRRRPHSHPQPIVRPCDSAEDDAPEQQRAHNPPPLRGGVAGGVG